jgi:hypothetical protein
MIDSKCRRQGGSGVDLVNGRVKCCWSWGLEKEKRMVQKKKWSKDIYLTWSVGGTQFTRNSIKMSLLATAPLHTMSVSYCLLGKCLILLIYYF